MTRRLAALAVALAMASAVLTGCLAGEVQIDAYPTTKGSDVDCVGMLDDLPPSVAGQPRRLVKDRVAGAWGDPPIVLRCGGAGSLGAPGRRGGAARGFVRGFSFSITAYSTSAFE